MWVLDRGNGPLEIMYKSPEGIRPDADKFVEVDDKYKPYINVMWKYNPKINSFDVPDMEYIYRQFKVKVKDKRKELAEKGFLYGERRIPVTEDKIAALSSILNNYNLGLYSADVDFKIDDYKWMVITKDTIAEIATKAIEYSQKLFTAEKEHGEYLSSLHIKDLLEYDINQSWPEDI